MAGEIAMRGRRIDVLHDSERTRVTREFLGGRSIIRKTPHGADGPERLRREAAKLYLLRGVKGIVQLADAPAEPGSLMLEDVDGVSLAGVPMPLGMAQVGRLAL